MAWTPYQMLIAGVMVITGSINTLSTKWADNSKSEGRDGQIREFNHPFLQSSGMFLGEFTCLLAFKVIYRYLTSRAMQTRPDQHLEEQLPPSLKGNRNYNPIIFFAPAMCDLVATSTMYIGLTMTYASSFQMLRGALIIFTGLLSVAFLKKKLQQYQLWGILFIIIGLLIVGLSDLSSKSGVSHGRNTMITGDLLIVTAQIITAVQMVLEERFVTAERVSPLEAVGWEGFFGFLVMSFLLIPFYFINVGNQIFKNPGGRIEDAIDGFYQIKNNWQVAAGFCGTIVSISFFNFAGVSVTKELSATTRTVLDTIRTFVVWLFGLAVGWQDPSLLQALGFFVLMIGMFLYNNVLILPAIKRALARRQNQDSDVEDGPIVTQTAPDEEEIVS